MAMVRHAHELNADTWENCDNLGLFGEFFAVGLPCPRPPSDRKFRLMVVAALRAVWEHITDLRSRAAVEAAEQYADTRDPSVLARARPGAEQATDEAKTTGGPNDAKRQYRQLVAGAAWQCLDPELNNRRWPFWVETVTALENDGIPGRTQQAAEALHLRLFRDIFGNPFRPVAVDPAWLAWNHGTVPAIARHIYDDRAFHDLPILADALEDAGCTNADLLAHCRGPGPHVRGCWAVDLLLGNS
jgi:hypothetical protein